MSLDAGPSQEVDSAVEQRILRSQNEVLSGIDVLISSKLASFEQKISSTQRDISESQLAKIQQNILLNDSYSFKRKGNEEQFKSNVRVLDKLREADSHLKDALTTHYDESTIAAKTRISEGIDILIHRQKLVKLADSSELGWRVVQEYESHPLASDEEDEKRMYRATARATRKFKQDRGRFSRRSRPYNVPQATTSTATSANSPTTYTRGRKPGTCYFCGKVGHWRLECPSLQSTETADRSKNTQMSILFNNSFHKSRQNENQFSPSQALDNLSGSNLSLSASIHYISTVNLKDTDSTEQTGSKLRFNSEYQTRLDEPKDQTTRVALKTPVGRLKNAYDHWERSGASDQVLDIISNGYKIPFKEVPDRVILPNNKSAKENPSFVSSEIENLIQKGCVSEVFDAPHVVNPLTVAYNRGGKPRLVLDCRHINPHLFKYKCCFEDHSIAKGLFQTGDFLFTFDLKSAYHHVVIMESHRTYLGFHWTQCGVTRYFVFNVLPFGISTAGYIFTKVLRAVVKSWRAKGHRIIVFLDDGIGGAKGIERALAMSTFIRQDLLAFGFLLADEKCSWDPALVVTWLGHVWDMVSGKVSVTPERLERLDQTLDWFIRQVSKGSLMFTARKLAGLIGQIISMQCGIGSAVRLRTRELYKCLLAKASWDSPVMIQSGAFQELLFWKENLSGLNGKCLGANDSVDKVIVSDASAVGYGGYIEGLADSELIGSWSQSESIQSSTWRELEAVRRVVEHSKDSLEGQSVVLKTDNKNVTSILKTGSRVPELQEKAIAVNEACSSKSVCLLPTWVPREKIEKADFLSRCTDSDDWGMKWWVFLWLDHLWGPHTYDRFASDYNAKCATFSSRWWCPGTSAIDAFSESWQGHNNWLVPPPRLIVRCLHKLRNEGAEGTLIVPKWQSAPFWPLLYPDGQNLAKNVSKSLVLPGSILTVRGRGKNGIFCGKPLKFDMIAFKFSEVGSASRS
ncbi:MAG: reverse transcriptase domain-containing protein [Candidatus Thiodiazotropha sp.]